MSVPLFLKEKIRGGIRNEIKRRAVPSTPRRSFVTVIFRQPVSKPHSGLIRYSLANAVAAAITVGCTVV